MGPSGHNRTWREPELARRSGALQPRASCHRRVAFLEIGGVGEPRPCGASSSCPTPPRQGIMPGVSRWLQDVLGSWKCRK